MKARGQLCSVHECNKPVAASGLCWMHYGRIRRTGHVDQTLRRYGQTPQCRFCGTTDPGNFYAAYKSICKTCRKLRLLKAVTEAR